MVALWIILGILAAIVLLLAILMLLPIDLLFLLEKEQGFALRYRFLGKVFGGEEHSGPENPIATSLKKALGISRLESIKSIRSTVESHGAAATVQETVATLMDLIERVFWLLKRCKIAKCKIISVCGGEDAPLDYGTSCAVIYPLVSYFEAVGHLHHRNKEVRIFCDYDRPESALELEVAVRIHLWYLVRALLHIIKKNVEKEVLSAE